MVVVDPEIALTLHGERHARVLRQRRVHLYKPKARSNVASCVVEKAGTYMVEEPDTSRHADLLLVSRPGLTIQVDSNRDLRLARLALNRRCSSRHFRSLYLSVSDSGWESRSL